jgi:hypothetical protein
MYLPKMKKIQLEALRHALQEKRWFVFGVLCDKTVCLSSQVSQAPNEYSLRRHYVTLHKDKCRVFEGAVAEYIYCCN